MSSTALSAKSQSTTTTLAPSPSTSSQVKDSARPIDNLSTPAAQVYTHVHAAALLALPWLSFPALVADPVTTLASWLAPVAALQTLYCVLCLPVTGSSLSKGSKRKVGSAGRATESSVLAGVVPAILSLLLTLALAAPAVGTAIVLFGAPLTTHHAPTALLALHLALLAAPPLFYTHGLAPPAWRRLAALQLPLDEVLGLALGTLAGAWLGAVPIPLDWDRDWQRWPVTVVAGAFAGAVAGKMLGGWVFKGKRIHVS